MNLRVIFWLVLASAGLGAMARAAAPPLPARAPNPTEQDRIKALRGRLYADALAGRFEQAARLARDIARLREDIQGRRHWESIDARFAAQKWQRLADGTAMQQMQAALVLRQALFGHAALARLDHAKARQAFEQALRTARTGLGEDHPETAVCASNLAHCLGILQKGDEARRLIEQALRIQRKALGEQHPDTATSLNNLAAFLQKRGESGQARQMYEQALAIRRRVLGEEHPDTAGSYNNLAFCLNDLGLHTRAGPLYEQALAINRRLLGEEHAATAQSYSNLAVNLDQQGLHARALGLHRKALLIRRRVLGPGHPLTAYSYNNLASCFGEQGRHPEALLLYEKALLIFRKLLGEEHPDTATGHNNVGVSLNRQGKHDLARKAHEKALAIRRKALGKKHPAVAGSCNNLAGTLEALGKHAEAQALYEEALVIHVERLGAMHPHTALTCSNLALNLLLQGKLARAQELSERALAIRRKLLGEEHPATAQGRSDLAVILFSRGKYAGAPLARLNVADSGFERSLHLAGSVSPRAGLAVALARLKLPARAWAHAERHLARGLLDDLGEAPAAGGPRLARLGQLDRLLVGLLVRTDLGAADRKRRDELWAERQALLTGLARERAGRAARRVLPLPHIQKQIPADAALLVWLSVGNQRWACVVRRQGEPAWQQLRGSGEDGLWTEADRALSRRAYRALRSPEAPPAERARVLGDLYQQRLAPLAAHLKGVRQLLVVPVGEMARVPVEALTDRFTVSYVPSGTVFARLAEQHRGLGGETLLALGDPAFQASTAQPLPGTRREVEALARLVPACSLLLGRRASTSSLGQLARSDKLRQFRLLHLATHGEVDDRRPERSALLLAHDQPARRTEEVESILGVDRAEEGRLTVGAILRTWRLNADLVVLSACESGLGRDAGGNGLLGFAQALLSRGARSVVLSRWKVDDTATALLMVRFYENLLGKRTELKQALGRAEALAEAKRWLAGLERRKAEALAARLGGGVLRGTEKTAPPVVKGKPAKLPGGEKPFAHPYYWAAFVLVGDPA